jgi:hypothetical protein
MPNDENPTKGLRIRYVTRLMRRLFFQIDDIEPQIGLTRYSVFEQARESGDTSPGAVTLSLVGAEGGFGEIFTRIDTVIDRWEGTL